MSMIYRDFGKTGARVSILGYGCMRLPMTTVNTPDGEKQIVDDGLATPLLRRAVELGVNFFDTHWFYCNHDSQRAVGAALAPMRDRVYISTKVMLNLIEKKEDLIDYIHRALDLMGLDYIDFYHFPALSYQTWQNKIVPMGLIDQAEKAKAQGLIRHLSFSFHSDPDKMPELIGSGAFSSMLAQYNLVDRTHEELLHIARDAGLGTMVMGPLMGGAITDGGENFVRRMGRDAQQISAAELALRFAWSHPAVDMVLSGMGDLNMLEQNALYASHAHTFTPEERAALITHSHSLKELSDLYCTACNYCLPCPQDIRVGRAFQLYLQHHVWGLTDAVKKRRATGGRWAGADPATCTHCGACVPRCPQGINIPAELKRTWDIVQGL